MLGNPIYVSTPQTAEPRPPAASTPADARWLYVDGDAGAWRLERDTDSAAAVDTVAAVTGRMLVFRFGLASGKTDYWAALVHDLSPSIGEARRVRFTGRASRPVRLSVQVRSSDGGGAAGLRWRRSVYLDEAERDIAVAFADMSPVGRGTSAGVPDSADAILFVVDPTHFEPGATGIIWLDAIRIER
jgi:hypothetical protein